VSVFCQACGGTGLRGSAFPLLGVLTGADLTVPIKYTAPQSDCGACGGSGKAHVLWDVDGSGERLRLLSVATLQIARSVH